jgi:hypothetical protein
MTARREVLKVRYLRLQGFQSECVLILAVFISTFLHIGEKKVFKKSTERSEIRAVSPVQGTRAAPAG